VGFGQLNIVVMALAKGAGEGNNPDQPWPPFCDLKRAGALRASLMAQVQTDSITGPPISECIEKSLATREQDLDPRTLNQHRFAPERFRRFLETQNVVHMREIEPLAIGLRRKPQRLANSLTSGTGKYSTKSVEAMAGSATGHRRCHGLGRTNTAQFKILR
jgi:hypothetical protein